MNEYQKEFIKLLQDDINKIHKDKFEIDDYCLADIFNHLDAQKIVEAANHLSPKIGYEFNINAISSGGSYIPGCVSIDANKVADV